VYCLLFSDVDFTAGGTQGSSSPQGRTSNSEEHRVVERTNSDQSTSSLKLDQSSPVQKQEPSSPYPTQQTPPSGSQSPSVSPAASSTNLTNAPIAER